MTFCEIAGYCPYTPMSYESNPDNTKVSRPIILHKCQGEEDEEEQEDDDKEELEEDAFIDEEEMSEQVAYEIESIMDKQFGCTFFICLDIFFFLCRRSQKAK